MEGVIMRNNNDVVVLKSGDLTFDNKCIVLSLSIYDISGDLKAKLEKAIGKAKEADTRYIWSNEPAVMDFTYFRVVFEEGKEMDCSIQMGFHEAHNEEVKIWDCSLKIDLLENEERLKRVVLNMLIDALF